MRATFAVCVVACLCFSVGEGLRLTPFPVSPRAASATEQKDAQLQLNVQPNAPLHRGGPLDVPAQAQIQKRGKRQAADYDYPPTEYARRPPADLPSQLNLAGPVSFPSSVTLARPSDRSPPFIA